MAIDDVAITSGPCMSAICAPDQFACWDKSCIPTNLTCEGNSDCPDGSDEVFCNRMPIPSPGVNCGNPAVLSGNIGSFTSPGYPNSYPNNALCSWQISVNTSEVIAIRFDVFDLNHCYGNSLTIYDGSSTVARRVDTLCGSNGRTIFTTGRNAFVVFRTDGLDTRSGFSATFAAERRPCQSYEFRCNISGMGAV
ncbi:PREDICTED: membrane frizzled-related protein-like [Branchiostoma belcheri]|uniref:Membrane frizzled-related protein-like n=1 Tax=Branchiostoma belcheri TaxID=7741 RepID=A0A6P4YLW6_BRABE|nr:PREDICTED: membrane frizzled-related protein-like [Branchiostoma belcheri]